MRQRGFSIIRQYDKRFSRFNLSSVVDYLNRQHWPPERPPHLCVHSLLKRHNNALRLSPPPPHLMGDIGRVITCCVGGCPGQRIYLSLLDPGSCKRTGSIDEKKKNRLKEKI